ncbi:hypothetical protein HY623_00990 [Candidatus Uhrbacteria bacterium]|nr:hypothetical protein [Candidatus Uhrbacteria bacterium]
MATQEQILDIAATLITDIPKLTFEDAQRLIGMKKKLHAKAAPALQQVISEVLGKQEDDLTSSAPEKPATDELPTEMTLGGRIYDILTFVEKGDRGWVDGTVMHERGKKLHANMGAEDSQWILDHQDEIPVALRGKVYFAFPEERNGADAAFVGWDGGRWYRLWNRLGGGDWSGRGRLLRLREVSSN